MDSKNKVTGESYMIKKKVINNPYVLEVGTAKYLRAPMSPNFQVGILYFMNTI